MLLAFSANAFTRFSLEQALRGIAAAGFRGVELLADEPHLYPGRASDDDIAACARLLDKLGLAVSNINSNCSFGYWRHAPPEPYFEPSLISPNALHREDRIRMIGRTLEIARRLSAPCISITSGRLLGGMPPEMAAPQLETSLRRVLDLADRAGIKVGIECEPGLMLEYTHELHHWIGRIGSPLLGANLDVGHSQVLGEDIPASIRLLRGRIWNLHLEDIPGRKHYHLIPGQGTMDWTSLFTALREVGYVGGVTVELYTHTVDPHRAASTSFDFLRPYVA